jgi:hypothetical protein
MMVFGEARTVFHHFAAHWDSLAASHMNNSADSINPRRMSIEPQALLSVILYKTEN